ncbi:MAG: sensor histidine kinase [Candidatus Nitrosotenuis sp.]|nr:MAG: sensor histidine kinase [Candidatus Nitrosotenuis sp.]
MPIQSIHNTESLYCALSLNREIMLTIIILVSATVLIVGVLGVYTYNEIQRLNDEITKTKINEVTALSSRFALRLQYATGIMELTSQTYPMTKPPTYSNLISDDLKGIPDSADAEKRDMAKKMIDKKFDFDYVFYAVPGGDIYFLEPFSSQLKLSQLNFAFRDWYRGATSTGSTYVSEVYVSANEKHNVMAIAVPIYDDSSQTLNGIFVGALNLGALQRSLSQVNLGQNEYFLIIDHNNNVVADSRKSESDIEIRKFTLDLSEQRGADVNTVTKAIDGTDQLIAFKTLAVGTHEWSIMSIQPHHDAFASSNALRNEALGIIATVVTITSITGFFMIRKINTNMALSNQLKQTNSALGLKTEQIKQIDIQKEEFSAMVTHELKTPLVPIIGYCKMLKSKMLGELNKEQLDSIDTIDKSAKRLESLISDIMDVRKLDLNKMKFDIDDFSIDDLFEGLSASYKVLKEKGKDFTTNLPARGLTIKTDKARLRQVFDNLISNAIKFTPEQGGKIEVGATKEDGKIIFYVKDNGIGIPKDKQEHLFKKFYQIDTSERRKAGGTGLGLAISKGIVEKLNGRIWVESDAGTGSVFYIELSG